MKKITTILIILLLTFQSAFWGTYLIIRKEHNYRLTVKNLKQISKTNLLEFSFEKESYDALNWVKPQKEFILNNDFYDIVSMSIHENTIKLICYKDIKDKEIAQKIKENSQSGKKESKIISKFLDLKYYQEIEYQKFENFIILRKDIIESAAPKIIFANKVSPPPKFSI